MVKIFSQDHDIIKIQFPQKKFESLLARLSVSVGQKLSTEDTKKTFLLSIEEFQAGGLALDEMSEIAEKLWSDTKFG